MAKGRSQNTIYYNLWNNNFYSFHKDNQLEYTSNLEGNIT